MKKKVFTASNGDDYIVRDYIGLEFVDGTDFEQAGLGIQDLTVTGEVDPDNLPDYCNYTITPTDINNAWESGGAHYYPVLYIKVSDTMGALVPINDPSHLDEPIPGRGLYIPAQPGMEFGIRTIEYRPLSAPDDMGDGTWSFELSARLT